MDTLTNVCSSRLALILSVQLQLSHTHSLFKHLSLKRHSWVISCWKRSPPSEANFRREAPGAAANPTYVDMDVTNQLAML